MDSVYYMNMFSIDCITTTFITDEEYVENNLYSHKLYIHMHVKVFYCTSDKDAVNF